MTSPTNVATRGFKQFSPALILDVVERVMVFALCLWLMMRFVWAGLSLVHVLLIVSEGLNAFFIMVRRPTDQVSRRPREWLLAVGGTVTPLFVVSATDSWLIGPEWLPGLLLLLGLLTQVSAKLTLGRSFGMVAANRGLKLFGPYRLVRHPMYFGYFLTHVGFFLANANVWNLCVYVLEYSFQVPRLFAEERILAEDDEYRDYQQQVRYRLIPGLL